jgi:dipeptidyl aminopeptidase/acylaminoacyl peptidase
MDIYRYTIATKTLTQLTHTPEGEYSPLVTPDGKTFSVIRTEADGTQRLWRFDLDGTNPRLVLENIKPVGYHVWIDATHLGLFVLGQPATLQIADTTTGTAQVADSRIGRSLQRNPTNGRLTYVVKPDGGGHWIVKEIDPKTREIVTLTETPDNNQSEDLVWHPSGLLLMASGTKLVGWKAGQTWTQIRDFSNAGINRITRMAMSTSHLALVAEPLAK